MAWTLTDIQTQIAAELDGSATIASTSADWANRLVAINRSLIDWAETTDWNALLKVHNGQISTATGNASYALPTDFRKLDSTVRIAGDEYPIVHASKTTQYVDSDKYAVDLGNDRDGHVLYIHAPTLASGASVQFSYYASPASMATTTDVVACPDPTFILQRSLYYIYKSREDGRFPEAKAESDKILARMLENEVALGRGYVERNVPNWMNERHSFRIGRD